MIKVAVVLLMKLKITGQSLVKRKLKHRARIFKNSWHYDVIILKLIFSSH